MFQFIVGTFAEGQAADGSFWVGTTLPVGNFATGQTFDDRDDWTVARLTSYD